MIVETANYKAWFKVFAGNRRILHREGGPAIEWKTGSRGWYLNGREHRTDGPALEWADGTRSWYLHGLLQRFEGPTAANLSEPS